MDASDSSLQKLYLRVWLCSANNQSRATTTDTRNEFMAQQMQIQIKASYFCSILVVILQCSQRKSASITSETNLPNQKHCRKVNNNISFFFLMEHFGERSKIAEHAAVKRRKTQEWGEELIPQGGELTADSEWQIRTCLSMKVRARARSALIRQRTKHTQSENTELSCTFTTTGL